jgi:hypothetical protein
MFVGATATSAYIIKSDKWAKKQNIKDDGTPKEKRK